MNCTSCNTANPSGARFCIMCGEQLQSAGSRERRRVSVVFIDLTAFTTLTLGFDPEELRDLADEVLTVVAGVIEDYDGYVDAFRGDGLIALFGAPKSHPDDPQRAVMAAAAGLRAIESIGRDRGYPLKGRAGVNTGIVIAGAVGSGRVRDYTVMGSTVNLAARLEAAAIPGEVWVGQETFESTRHRLVYEVSPPIRLAGFPNVRHAYRLVSPLEEYDHDPYGYLQFVGRDAELQRLEETYRLVRESGVARQLWLHGEAGSGKTRLLREFARRVGATGGQVLWLAGAPQGSSAWQQLARQLFGFQGGEEARVQQLRASQVLSNVLPGKPKLHRLILDSLDLNLSDDESPNGNGSRPSASAVAGAWRDLLVGTARQQEQPLLLAVDARSLDRQMLQLHPLLDGAAAPLLLIRTSRNAPAGQEESLALPPLPAEGSRQLLSQLASPELLAASHTLVAQVGGVPAYIIELGRALSSARSGSVSGSLASLLQARLDLLSPAERQMLSLAALSGERSWERMLLQLSLAGEAELQRLLRDDLLVTETTSEIPGEVAYRFQSELLRHAVLRMIPFGDRPILHLKIAGWLEQHAPLALSEQIAHHFAHGESPESAFPHYLAAADLAASQGDERAKALYGKLLELELPAELQAQGRLAFAQHLLDSEAIDEAQSQLEEAERCLAGLDSGLREELTKAHEQLVSDVEEYSPGQ